jgi:hypothetical protein
MFEYIWLFWLQTYNCKGIPKHAGVNLALVITLSTFTADMAQEDTTA